MRSTIFSLVSFIVLLSACTKNKTSLSGHYTGTFKSTSPRGNGATAHVTLNLIGNNYTGTTDITTTTPLITAYPEICQGTWTPEKGHIKFTNTCFFTANTNLEFLLDGDYDYSTNGKHLTLTMTRDSYIQTYELEKQD